MESEPHSSSRKTNQSPKEPPPLEVSSLPRRTRQFLWQIVGVGICGILAAVVFFFTYVFELYDTTNGIIIGTIGIGVIFVAAILVFLYLRMRKKTHQVGDLENNNSIGNGKPPLMLEPRSHFVGVMATCGILVEGIFIWIFLTRFDDYRAGPRLILGLVITGIIFPAAIFVLFFLRWRMRKKLQYQLEDSSHAPPQ